MNSREKKYWNDFYKIYNNLEPSMFCKYIYKYLEKYNKEFNILDIGCGNGRDSYYLSKNHKVTGIDISNIPKNRINCEFYLENMVTCDKSQFDVLYSRFTFHSITDIQQEDLIKSIKKDTILCIETRSDKETNLNRIHGNTHYRNLTNIDKLKELLIKYNFEIIEIVESNNLAVYKTENPICIRVICKN